MGIILNLCVKSNLHVEHYIYILMVSKLQQIDPNHKQFVNEF